MPPVSSSPSTRPDGRRRPTSCSRGRSSGCRSRAAGRARVARVARTVAALAGSERSSPSTSPRRSPTARRGSWSRCEDQAVGELALAAFAAETGGHVLSEPQRRPLRALLQALRRGGVPGSASPRPGSAGSRRSDPGFPPSLRSIFDPPAGPLPPRRRRCRRCSTGPRSPSSARARARRTARTSRARSAGSSPPQAWWSSAAWRAAWTARRTAARSRPAVPPSPSSAAGSTATTRPRTRSSPGGSAPSGLVVSEYAPGVEPSPWRFPARNRIVAGLGQATVVVEARERSGALITADLALEEGREVFAVPGEITSALSAGTNALLRLGATAATSPADVLESFGLAAAGTARPALSPAAGAVLARLRDGPASADELGRARSGSMPARWRPRWPSSTYTNSLRKLQGSFGRCRDDDVMRDRRDRCPAPRRSPSRPRPRPGRPRTSRTRTGGSSRSRWTGHASPTPSKRRRRLHEGVRLERR